MLKANKSDSALPTGRKTEAELKVILFKKNMESRQQMRVNLNLLFLRTANAKYKISYFKQAV